LPEELEYTSESSKKYFPPEEQSMAEDVTKVLIDYVKKEYLDENEDREITEHTKLISSGIVDSFSMVSLKMFIEKRFQVRIPDQRATPEAFDSVTSIVSLLKEFKHL
jgi:acyl carrier protein